MSRHKHASFPVHTLLLARTLVFDSRVTREDEVDKYQTYTFTRSTNNVDAETPIIKLESVYDTLRALEDNYLADTDKYPAFHVCMSATAHAIEEACKRAVTSGGGIDVYTDLSAMRKYVRRMRDEDGDIDCYQTIKEECPPVCLLVSDICSLGVIGWEFDCKNRCMTAYLGPDGFKLLEAMVPEADDNCRRTC